MSSSQNITRHYTLVAGITLDGRIAGAEGDFSAYSSPEDTAFLQQEISKADVLVMGRKTYEKHVTSAKKPMIVFTTQAKGGLQLSEKDGHMLHLFSDTPDELINLCDALQYKNILCLGGAEVYHWFVENKLATDLYLTLEPYLFGQGRNLIHGGYLHHFTDWMLQSHQQLNAQGSVLLHYQPRLVS